MRPPGSPIPLEDDLVLPNQSPPGTPTPIRVCDEELVHDPTPEKIDDPPVVVADTNVVKNAPGAPDDAGKSELRYLRRCETGLTRDANSNSLRDRPEEAQTRSTRNPPQGGSPQA